MCRFQRHTACACYIHVLTIFAGPVLELFELHPDLRAVADFDLQRIEVAGADALLIEPAALQVEQCAVRRAVEILLLRIVGNATAVVRADGLQGEECPSLT